MKKFLIGAIAAALMVSQPAMAEVSVHDPSIIKAGGKYYIFGSHITAAKSDNLLDWEVFTNSYATPGNALFGDLSANLAPSFKWAGEDDSDCKGGFHRNFLRRKAPAQSALHQDSGQYPRNQSAKHT